MINKIFETSWINELERQYNQRPGFMQPAIYRFATHPKWAQQRAQLDEWISRLPVEQQAGIVHRLREPDQFFSTYNELIISEVIHHCGHRQLEYEKLIDDKTPDWYVSPIGDFPEFVVEVVTIMPSKEFQDESRLWNELRYRIGQNDHYFHLMMKSRTTSAIVGKDIKKAAKFVHDWLSSIEPNKAKLDQKITYRDNNLQITYSLIPRRTDDRRRVEVAGPIFTSWVNPDFIKNAIAKKVNKYKKLKDLKIPLVIAVIPAFESGIGIDTLLDALFGKEQITIDSGELSRDRTGMLVPRFQRGDQVIFNTRLSTILFLEQHDNLMAKAVHNPFAQNRLAPDVFTGLPNLIARQSSGSQVEMYWEIP